MSAIVPPQLFQLVERGDYPVVTQPWLEFFTSLAAPRLTGSATYNPPSIAAAGTTTTTVTVTGAVLGQDASASFSLSLQGLMMTAYVSAANTVTVVLFNPTAGAIDLLSGTLKVFAWKS